VTLKLAVLFAVLISLFYGCYSNKSEKIDPKQKKELPIRTPLTMLGYMLRVKGKVSMKPHWNELGKIFKKEKITIQCSAATSKVPDGNNGYADVKVSSDRKQEAKALINQFLKEIDIGWVFIEETLSSQKTRNAIKQ